jgi:hypothetical protein
MNNNNIIARHCHLSRTEEGMCVYQWTLHTSSLSNMAMSCMLSLSRSAAENHVKMEYSKQLRELSRVMSTVESILQEELVGNWEIELDSRDPKGCI